MDITSTPMGAAVDVTESAIDTVLEMLAEALCKNSLHAEFLLFELRGAVETRGKFLDREATGRTVSPETMAEVSKDLDAARDALKAMLAGRVLVSLPAVDCLKKGAELIAAGKKAQARWRTPGQPLAWLPEQHGWSMG